MKDPSNSDRRDKDEPVQVVLSDDQAKWLALQSVAMGTPAEEILMKAVDEWLTRNQNISLPGASYEALVKRALDDFILRHQAEFLPVEILRD
jgi:hypothetical protein